MAKTFLPKKSWPGRFDESYYNLIISISECKDHQEWMRLLNQLQNIKRVLLVGANLYGAYLKKVDLSNANLEGANLKRANLEGANLSNAKLNYAKLQGASLKEANLEEAHMFKANLQEDTLQEGEILEKITNLMLANLKGADLWGANLRGAFLYFAIVDGKTLISDCITDDKTDFTGVGLGDARIDPQLKSTLEANVRRLWWVKNYSSMNWFIRYFCKFFWWLSDYGRSTIQLIKSFCYFALGFAILYRLFPGMVDNSGAVSFKDNPDFFKSLYFSVVTMTTLGFGDMHAADGSYWGYFCLSLHVIIGYVILGALIVRLGTLFSAVPPKHKKEAPPTENKGK
jgi:hypothetical protein